MKLKNKSQQPNQQYISLEKKEEGLQHCSVLPRERQFSNSPIFVFVGWAAGPFSEKV